MPTRSRALPDGAAAVSALWQALHAADPSAIALRDGRREIAYGALPSMLLEEMLWLHECGAARCALLADNGVPWLLADLALHLGEVLSIPLPPSFTPAQHAHVIEDAGVDVVLTDDLERMRAILPGWRVAGRSPAAGLHRLLRATGPAIRPAVPPGTRKITYTSGSSGA